MQEGLCNHELSVVCWRRRPALSYHILGIYVHMPLVYTRELLSQYNMYFLNGSHFS